MENKKINNQFNQKNLDKNTVKKLHPKEKRQWIKSNNPIKTLIEKLEETSK